MKAAIYCRVSTDSQEREGTSLQTQLENCLTYCKDKGYDVAYRFVVSESGLVIDQPIRNELRELVRAEQIDVVVVYCLDRLSRNATHGVILRDELDKHHVLLESVTEDIDKTPLGEAITYLRGTFSQIEAEKIKERTMRGKKARAREGRMPMGSGIGLYGYDYIPVSQKGGGQRVINEIEASWVRKMYEWLVNEGLSATAITFRLRAINTPTKSGKIWGRRQVHKILTNIAYTGKTYVFTTSGDKVHSTAKEDWIELPDVTPAIISQELFEAAQKQLKINFNKSIRNCKHEYLLRGHLRCSKCGYAFVGHFVGGKKYYHCSHTTKINAPIERCTSRMWDAEKIETLVWAQLEYYLSDRNVIARGIENQLQDASQLGVFETQLHQIERQLKAANREQHQLLQWALKDFPVDQVEAENMRLNKAKETLKAQKTEVEAQLKASRESSINMPKLENFIKNFQEKLPTLDFEGNRLALDMLGITVYINDHDIEITGVIEPELKLDIVRPSSRCSFSGDYH
ncbi:recombinase family protein [Chloroflexota bacterium]